ncbi:centrosomal protein of 55 kDa [Patella vulgata]|uniref:centrosomal protein of 55 kDa n=1 Tax=Patella vulgata TaxID=6465 RepID=UPI00217FC3E9|nr:centrosomal protein of 55 kDa [Patella vulgata]XP_050398252.1 centrosomal protein of 55 kDa [Patella vulgata]
MERYNYHETMTDQRLLQENKFLKDKIENLKIVIKQYSNELTSEKMKSSGMTTVATLLTETQRELQRTFKQKKALEAAVKNLQNRLLTNHLPDDVSIGESDVYIASLCPQTLENLASENVRLKNLLHNCATTEKLEELNRKQDNIDTLNDDIRELTLKNERLENELKKYQNLEKPDSFNTMDSIPNKEVVDIQTALRKLVNQCQDFDMKLNKVKDENSNRKVETKPTTIENLQSQLSNNIELSILKDQNQQQRKKLEEVSAMNMRWQEYNSQREEHVRSLNSKVLELQTQLSERPAIGEGINTALREASEQIKFTKQAKEQAQGIAHELQLEVDTKDALIKRLEAQMRNVGNPMNNDNDRVDVLMAQIQVCTEDFENERRDRVRVLSELTELRETHNQTKKELERYKVLNQNRFIPGNQSYYQGSFNNTQQSPIREQQLSSRGRAESELVIDGPGFSLNGAQGSDIRDDKNLSKSLPVSSAHSNIEILCCPKCGKDFSEGEKLITHIESCVE